MVPHLDPEIEGAAIYLFVHYQYHKGLCRYLWHPRAMRTVNDADYSDYVCSGRGGPLLMSGKSPLQGSVRQNLTKPNG